MSDQRKRIISSALELTSSANENVLPLRRVSPGTVAKIVDRSLSLTKSLPFSLREHLALRDVSDFITVSQRGHGHQRITRNIDLLPIGHPLSTKRNRCTEASLREARANWISTDPFIRTDDARALVAAAYKCDPDSAAYQYYVTRMQSLPQGTIPIRALVASSYLTGGNSSAARSMRAKLQRRDRRGRFAWQGGGLSALVRRANGQIYRLSGRLVAQGGQGKAPGVGNDTFDVELPNGEIKRVPTNVSEGFKAFLPTPGSEDGFSPTPADVDAADKFIEEADLETVEAPSGFYKDTNYSGPGEKFTDDAYDVLKFDPNDEEAPDPSIGTIDFNKPIYLVRRADAEPKDTDTVVQSWADVQEYIRLDEIDRDKEEGRKPSIVARLDDDQLEQLMDAVEEGQDPEQVAAELFKDIFGGDDEPPSAAETAADFPEVPEGAYVPDTSVPYEPEGRTDQESEDYTDDPTELANRTEDFSDGDLVTALKGAVLPGDGVPATGMAQLPFDSGDEYVPAEAIYEALELRGEDPKARLADIYDSVLEGTPNRDAIKSEEPKAEVPEEAPEAPEEPELPALLQGLSDEELNQYKDTGDYKPFLPKNESFLPPQDYYPLDPEPFENTTESPDIDPINLANTTETSDLVEALRESLEPGNDGMGSVLRKDEDGEDVQTSVPAEALRDALQLQGEDTNAFIKDVYDNAEADQEAEAPPEAPKPEPTPEPEPAPEPEPIVTTAVSEEGKYYSVKPNGEIDTSLQYTDEYIEHLFSTPAQDMTLSELSDLENIHNQLPPSVKLFTGKAANDAKKRLEVLDLGLDVEPEGPSFDGDRYVGGAPEEAKEPRKPKKEAAAPEPDNTIPIPETPHVATVKTSELLPGDVTTKDNFVIEEVFADLDSLEVLNKPGGGMWVVGHYPGHVSQKTKIWGADTPIEVYRGVDAPEAGDKPELSKPKTDKYQKKNGGKGMVKNEDGQWEPKDPQDKEEYFADLADYEKALTEAKDGWSPPEGIEQESFESSETALSVDPINPTSVLTVNGPDLSPGDVTFKKEWGKDYFEYFVVEGVETKDDGTVEVTGYYPNHVSQTKTWQQKTPINVIRGINEPEMPKAGELPALERPKKGEDGYADKKKIFDDAKKLSAEAWEVPYGIDLENALAKKPTKPKRPIQQPFFGPKMKEILDQANGDPAEVARLLEEQEVVYFDFETDGNGYITKQKPIQVAAYKYKNGELVDEYVAYMNPGTELGSFYTEEDPEKILKDSDGNPISNEFLSGQQSREEAIQGLLDFMGPEPIVVAHNAPFDLGVLGRETEEFGVDFTPGGVIDTLGLARASYDAPGYTLEDVASRYMLADSNTDWHDAKTDAAVLEGITFNLLDEIAATGQGLPFLNFDLQEKLIAADKERFNKENSEYKKQKADYEAAKVVSDGLAGKEIPDTAQELIDKVVEPEKVPADEVGPNDAIPPQNIDTYEPTSLSVDGTPISNTWVNDNENTTELLGVAVEDWKVGDFFPAAGGGWWEITDISPDEDDEKRMKILANFVGSGNSKQSNYIKYNTKIPIRRPNGNIEGTESEVLDAPFEGATEPPKPAEDEFVTTWKGYEVVKGSDGIHYIKNINSSLASQLKHKQVDPPALPLFVPLGGGNNRETGEGHYYDINGGVHYGKYGASGALVRRLNSDGEYEYLLGLRNAGQSTGGNTWAFPAGAHKDYESSKVTGKTAKTEFLEEVGEDISGLEPISSIDYTPSPDWKFNAQVYEVAPGKIDNPTPKDGENQKFDWFTKDQIKQLQADGKLHPEFADYVDNIFDLAGPEAAPTPEAEKEPEAVPSEISLEMPIDTSGWIKGDYLGGSNQARLYTDPATGEEYVVKYPKSEAHARNEVLASAFYEAAGLNVGRVFLGKDDKGKIILISPFVDGSKKDFGSRYKEDAIKQSAYKGFAVDAWMNNYDAVGLEYDNMITLGDEVYRIDPGGALIFRAQGADKKSQLTPEATQIDTLRDPKVNPQMGSVFGDMTDADIAESAKALEKITPEQIDSMVDKAFGDIDAETAEFIKNRLKARREDILNRFPPQEVAPEPEQAEAPAPEVKVPEISSSLDGIIKDVMSFESVDQLKEYLDALEGTEVAEDPQVQAFIKKINDAQILDVAELPDVLSKDEAKANDIETSSIDDELDGVESSLSSDEIEDTYNPENPDQIIDSINAVYPGSENGDGTWTVASYLEGKYQIVLEKNKDNTFSVIYVKNNPDGTVTSVDKYGTYHSFYALNNRAEIANGKLLSALIMDDSDAAMNEFFNELAKKTYWSTTGKSKVDLQKIKITHPSPDGATEINKGDQIWDSKTGKFGKVMYRFTVYAVQKGKYVYTDYVRLKFDDGTYTNAPTTKRVWKVGSDGKIVAKPGSAPEFFPNPGTYKPSKATTASAPEPKPVPKDIPVPEKTPTPPAEGTPEEVVSPPTPEVVSEDVDPVNPFTSILIDNFSDLQESGVTYDKNSAVMLNDFGATTYNEYKAAIQGQKVKESTDKNILPSFIVENENGSIGIVTSISPSDSKASVSWITGQDAGTDQENLDSKSLTSKESYIQPATAKSVFNVSVDTSIQESAKKYMEEQEAKKTEAEKKKAEAAKKKAEAEAAKQAAQKALKNGPGFDPVVVQDPPSWSESVFETPSLESALDKVKQSETEANNGSDVLIDADQIENLKVRVTQVKNLTDEVKTRLRFKLTDWAGNRLSKSLDGDSTPEGISVLEVTDGMKIRKFETNENGSQIRVEQGVWKHYSDPNGINVDPSKKGRTFKFEITDEQGNVIGYGDLHRANQSDASIKSDNSYTTNKNVSNHNEIDLYLSGDATPEDIERALARMGISSRPATQEDVNGLVENKIISLFGGFTDPSKNLTGEERKNLLDKINADWGVNTGNVTAKVIDPNRGTIAFQMPREVAEKIVDSTSRKVAYHHWGGSMNSVDKIFELVFGGKFNSAMLPTDIRMAEGINKSGSSSTQDNNTLGADYMFFYGKNASVEDSAKSLEGHGAAVVFDLTDLVQNFDWFATPGDWWGKRNLDQDNLFEITRFSQFMVRDAVPFTLASRIVIPTNLKAELKKRLQQEGITEWNGIPVDKLFGLTGV